MDDKLMSYDSSKFPERTGLEDHQVTVYKCSFRRQRLVPEAIPHVMNIKEAVSLLAPSKTSKARANVLKLKSGQFIGVKSADLSNFVIVNPTNDGDIRWLLAKHPDIEKQVRDIYLVDSVVIKRNSINISAEDSGAGQ